VGESTLCRTCEKLRRCELIGQPPEIEGESLSTDEDPRECREWSSAGPSARAVRLKAYEIGGLAALRAVRALSDLVIREEEAVFEDEEKPDIRGIAGDMIAYKAREEQLRYLTDDDGNFILDTHDQKIPRETFWLREYATDPEGPIGADKDVVWFWSRKQLIDAILKAEKESGIVTSASEMKKAERAQNKVAPKATPKKEAPKMKKINIRRGGKLAASTEDSGDEKGTKGPKAGGARGGAKLGRPATAKAPVEETAQEPAAVEAAEVDLGPVMEQMQQLQEQVQALSAQLEEVKETAVATTKLHCALLHDVLLQVLTETDENNLAEKGADLEAYMDGSDSSGN